MIPLSQFPKEAIDWAFDQVKDRGDWNSQTISDLADQYLKTNLMKADPRAPIMGSVTSNPEWPDLIGSGGMSQYEAARFPKEWKGCFLGRFDSLLSFRDFLKLKKEVLEAHYEYLMAFDASNRQGGPTPEWPEALQGLTREDIEILKM